MGPVSTPACLCLHSGPELFPNPPAVAVVAATLPGLLQGHHGLAVHNFFL